MQSTEDAQLGAATAIPDVSAPSGRLGANESAELNQFDKDGVQSHGIRGVAAYGGLCFAAVLYLAGLCAVAFFLGIWPCTSMVDEKAWHIVVAVLFVLFSVPTVLVIAVIKMASPSARSELPATVHEAMGRILEKAIDKLTG